MIIDIEDENAGVLQASSSDMPFSYVEFGAWENVKYFLHIIEDSYAGYSWQIWLAFHIVLLSLAIMAFGFFLFWFLVYRHGKAKKREDTLREKFSEKFRSILERDAEMTRLQVMDELDMEDEDLKKENAYHYAKILEDIRMSLHERAALPNMQCLATAIGVTDFFSENLIRNKDVFRTLQMLVMLQVQVNEGRISKYRNHKNRDIRMMSRLYHIICSTDNPYRYLEEQLNNSKSLYDPMLLHYIFGWLNFHKHSLPNFLYYVEHLTNDSGAAMMLNEIKHWGNDREKELVKEFLTDPREKVRKVAIMGVADIQDNDAEETLTRIYPEVSEELKQDILRALLALNSGRQRQFFRHAYDTSSSRETQVIALQCMFQYGGAA